MNKLEDQLVSFETAKLAKEKGFESVIGLGHRKPRGNYYNSNGELNGDVTIELVNKDFKSISAPTQSLLQKWLREKHNIHISISYGELSKKYMGDINSVNTRFIIQLDCKYTTYEEALEAGLQEALKLIKL